MKKIILITLLLVFSLEARLMKDQIGREVEVPDKVERIVVLMHQALDMLVQLNAQDKIVGVMDTWKELLGSNFEELYPGVAKLPKVGTLRTANAEAIAALKADVVIVTGYMSKDVIASLTRLKIPVVALSLVKTNAKNSAALAPVLDKKTQSQAYLDGLIEGVDILAELTNTKDQAKKLVAFMKESRKILASYMEKIKDQKLVTAYIANPNFKTYGSGKYTSSFLEKIHAVNVAEKEVHGSKQVSIEQIYKWNPEYIFVQNRYKQVYEEITKGDIWRKLPAVINKKVLYMPQYARIWGHPLPEVIALGELHAAKIFYPKLLKDYDEKARVNAFYKSFYRTDFKEEWAK